jgi:hypothetical protein
MLTALQIYELMRGAGFPGVVAVTMTAIALRESSGNPAAYNGNEATGDKSYGLLQINMLDKLGPARLAAFGIAAAFELFDPRVNAAAGFVLWGGLMANLKLCWYIDRGVYQTRYESHLPAAQTAALASALPLL